MYLNEIIEKFHSLIDFKLQFGKDVQTSINWDEDLTPRIKMRFTDVIFEGVLMHLWF